jgi:hypothetical protein
MGRKNCKIARAQSHCVGDERSTRINARRADFWDTDATVTADRQGVNDNNFSQLTMRVTRAVVDGVVDDVKNEYSEETIFRSIPISPQSCSTGKSTALDQRKAGSSPV